MFVAFPTNLTDSASASVRKTLTLFEGDENFNAYFINPFSIPNNRQSTEHLKKSYPIIREYQDSQGGGELKPKELYSIVSNEEMRQYRSQLEEQFPWLSGRSHIRTMFGESPVVIHSFVSSYSPDLVVVSIDEHDLDDPLTESVLYYFMNRMNFPLLLVPSGADVSFDKISTLYNLEPDTDFSVLDKLNETLGSKIDFIHLQNEKLDIPQNKGVAPSVKTTFALEQSDSNLSTYLDNNQVDLLAVSARRKDFFKEIFSLEIAKKVFLEKKIPLLCLPQSSKGGMI